MKSVNIIGSGLSGLSAALTLAQNHINCNLISRYPSERAQSVLAEGGINAALDTMGEGDSPEDHYEDTMRAGVYLADPNAVYNLTRNAPDMVRKMAALGVPFNRKDGKQELRYFGGQKKKRASYARSSTGKALMTAMIDEVRKYETAGIVTRYSHHEFLSLLIEGRKCFGVNVVDCYTREGTRFEGPVIFCAGGLNGFFPEATTGTTANSADAQAMLFAQGVRFGNLEMIQYHPTTVGIGSKRCLITEAARAEGGRLFIEESGRRRYFMEEKYPELGNLMPRDVVSREEYFLMHDSKGPKKIFLDLTMVSDRVWDNKLPDVRKELNRYLKIDPKTEPVPIEPGIHYFMGGIDVDEEHRTNIENLFAAGECCDQYHGANRLGGNSLLGALYGGQKAAETVARTYGEKAAETVARTYGEESAESGSSLRDPKTTEKTDLLAEEAELMHRTETLESVPSECVRQAFALKMRDILLGGLGIVRCEKELKEALDALAKLEEEDTYSEAEKRRFPLARAMLLLAVGRKESRGAHYRADFPNPDENLKKVQTAVWEQGRIVTEFKEIPERKK